MTVQEIEKEIRKILKGIDKDQIESSSGWWETSYQVEFGKKKLDKLIAFLKKVNND